MNRPKHDAVIDPIEGFRMNTIKFFFLLLLVAGCSASKAEYESIYWSDGDSGRLGETKFRLSNIDAPETGGVGAIGGAKCEHERELGFKAKAFMVGLTKDRRITITAEYGTDRYDRLVVDLSVDGADITKAAIAAGHLKPWPHKGRKQITKKPDWCSR